MSAADLYFQAQEEFIKIKTFGGNYGNCPICDYRRPLIPEADGTGVCLDCFQTRGGWP